MAKSFGALSMMFAVVERATSSLLPRSSSSIDIESGVTRSFRSSAGMKYLWLFCGASILALLSFSRNVDS
jgi:hypothetical protein